MKEQNQKIGIIGQEPTTALSGLFPINENKIQQIPTNPTSVENAGVEKLLKNEARRKMNAENRYKSRRGVIVKGSQENGGFTHNAVQIGRNEPCHCGSGVKYKKCHLEKQRIVKVP